MQTTVEDTITRKTKELCQAILDEPEFKDLRRRIDTFMADETAQTQYSRVAEKSEMLQHKQQMGAALSEDEITDFQKQESDLVNNPIARGFIEARQGLQQIHQTVTQYVTKTIELGRVPTDEDIQGGSCGHGCGCHH
jgi:cell fate (sporulation/competence/biofilm development) regulator YlbF (YheA/YmcA/DUF963 family)